MEGLNKVIFAIQVLSLCIGLAAVSRQIGRVADEIKELKQTIGTREVK